MPASTKLRPSTIGLTARAGVWLPLAATLVSVGVASSACSDEFGSCYETRTCPRGPGEAGAGAGGEAAGAGGAPPSEGGSPTGGMAGADPQSDALAIESVTPADQALGVERDAVVEVVFSEELDAATVDSDSFKVVGSAGVVAGTIEVGGAKVSFAPDAPWNLLADYTIEVSTAVAGTSGSVLDGAEAFGFQSRDGIFTKPKRLWAKSSISLDMKGSAGGHAVVHWLDEATPQSVLFAFYDPRSASWSEPAPADAKSDQNYPSACVSLNDTGEAFAIVGSNSYIWNRAVDSTWGSATSSKPARSCALASDGTAIAAWEESSGSGWNYYAAILSPDDEWSEPELLQPAAHASEILRYDGGFLAFHRRDDEAYRLYSRVYDRQGGWQPAKAVTPPGIGHNYWSSDTRADVAMYTWIGDDGPARASLFDGTSWSSHELGLAAAGTHASVGVKGHLAAWNYDSNAYAARYDLESGWEEPARLGTAFVEPIWGPAATIDSEGHSLAVWPSGGSSILWRRMPADSDEWSDVQEIPDQDPTGVRSEVADSGEVMVMWRNALGVWASRFE